MNIIIIAMLCCSILQINKKNIFLNDQQSREDVDCASDLYIAYIYEESSEK